MGSKHGTGPGTGVDPDRGRGSTRVGTGVDPERVMDEIRARLPEADIVYVAALGHPYGDNDERVILRANLPDPDDPGETIRVVRLEFERATLDGIDFTTVDPLTIFELADDAVVDDSLEPPPPATTTTSSSTTTTTT